MISTPFIPASAKTLVSFLLSFDLRCALYHGSDYEQSGRRKMFMRPVDYFLAAALTAALSGTAAAQSHAPSPSIVPWASTQQPTGAAAVSGSSPLYPWVVSGFVGSSFATNTDLFSEAGVPTDSSDGGITYGFQLAYMWRTVGAEFLADFGGSPDFTNEEFFNNTEFAQSRIRRIWRTSSVSSVPRSLPVCMSGGLGTIRLSADVVDRSAW
jgi:hypothetical protein